MGEHNTRNRAETKRFLCKIFNGVILVLVFSITNNNWTLNISVTLRIDACL